MAAVTHRKTAAVLVIVSLLLAAIWLVPRIQNRPPVIQANSGQMVIEAARGRSDISGSIAFISDRDGMAAVFKMRADGSDVVRLTKNAGEDGWPSFSPDGTKIAYETKVDGRAQIAVMDADGNNGRILTSAPFANEFPTWSPDGKRIAFSSDRDGPVGIYVMSADGSAVQRLTDHPSNNWFPVWSPDGKRMAFLSDRDGTHGNVFVMDPQGAHLRQVTVNPLFAGKPAWSADGMRLAIFAEGRIFTINPDGTGTLPLVGEGEDPTWSPDGEWIAVASRRGGDRLQIYLVRPDGAELLRVTESSGEDWAPSWAR